MTGADTITLLVRAHPPVVRPLTDDLARLRDNRIDLLVAIDDEDDETRLADLHVHLRDTERRLQRAELRIVGRR